MSIPRTRAAADLRAPVFRLHPDWRQIIRRAWSVRLMLLAATLSGAEVVCGALTSHPPINPLVFAALSGAVTAGAFVARLVVQKNMGDQQ